MTSRSFSAGTYAANPDYVVRVVPVSSYRYCWSPLVSDLLFAANRLGSAPDHEIESYLEAVQYREDRLEDAYTSGHEVMLRCEKYVAIPLRLLGNGEFASGSLVIM